MWMLGLESQYVRLLDHEGVNSSVDQSLVRSWVRGATRRGYLVEERKSWEVSGASCPISLLPHYIKASSFTPSPAQEQGNPATSKTLIPNKLFLILLTSCVF